MGCLTGFAPAPQASQARMRTHTLQTPLRKWPIGPGLHWRHPDFQSGALLTELPMDGGPNQTCTGLPSDDNGAIRLLHR